MKLFHSFDRVFAPPLADLKKGESPKYHLATTINNVADIILLSSSKTVLIFTINVWVRDM